MPSSWFKERPEWAGVALRFPGNQLLGIQLDQPDAIIECSYSFERIHSDVGLVEHLPLETRYKIMLNGLALPWQDWKNGAGSYQTPVESRPGVGFAEDDQYH